MSDRWVPFLDTLGRDLRRWFACERPEQPPDEWAVFHVGGCQACDLALKAATTVEPRPGRFRGWWESRDELP